jgi:hypothetical protein
MNRGVVGRVFIQKTSCRKTRVSDSLKKECKRKMAQVIRSETCATAAGVMQSVGGRE